MRANAQCTSSLSPTATQDSVVAMPAPYECCLASGTGMDDGSPYHACASSGINSTRVHTGRAAHARGAFGAMAVAAACHARVRAGSDEAVLAQ